MTQTTIRLELNGSNLEEWYDSVKSKAAAMNKQLLKGIDLCTINFKKTQP
jgi:hypothetical protein